MKVFLPFLQRHNGMRRDTLDSRRKTHTGKSTFYNIGNLDRDQDLFLKSKGPSLEMILSPI